MLNRRILSIGRRLRVMREEIFAAFGQVESCTSCDRPRRRVSGRHGTCRVLPAPPRCCTSRTQVIFNDIEMFFLAAGGTHPRHLRRPSEPVADACEFCGPDGCNLEPGDRPGVCVGFICSDLARELAARGDAKRINEMIESMEALQRIMLGHAAER